jgi:regulatory protein
MGEVIPIFGGRSTVDTDDVLDILAPAPLDVAAEIAPEAAPDVAPAEVADVTEFAPIEDASLRALGRRDMSRREMERLLAGQDYHQFAIADELDRLEGVGLIDDYALAQHLVAHLQERKGLTGGAIKAELVKRGVAPGAISYAIDLIDTADELGKARDLAAKRARQYSSLDAATAERRLTAFLMRRGFSSTTVRAAVESVRTA